MSAFKRGDRWVAKFRLNHQQHWVPGGPWDTKRQAQEAERQHRDFLTAKHSEETCETFAERWLEEWPRPATSTQRSYTDAAKRFGAHFGSLRLDEVTVMAARKWALSQPRGISRVIRVMFSDARTVGLVIDNPFDNLRLPKNEVSREVRVPTMEEYRACLFACSVLGGYGAEFRAMIQFSAWTGVRAGELHGLKWEDIGAETVMIRRARKRDGAMGKPKNGKERRIAFTPPARVLDGIPRRDDGFVFHAPRGNPLVQGSHHFAWREVRAAAGLKEMRWHWWRHFCATQLLELGMSHFDVATQLGHTDGGLLVAQTYGHPSEDAARRRVNQAFTTDYERILEDANSAPAVREHPGA